MLKCLLYLFFFFNDTATTEIYTLSLHDALPIYTTTGANHPAQVAAAVAFSDPKVEQDVLKMTAAFRRRRDKLVDAFRTRDRKSTRLNSSHLVISYAVFCLKKKME